MRWQRLFFVGWIGLCLPALVAQTGEQGQPELNLAAMQSRLESVKADAALTEAVKNTAVELLSKALEDARRAEEAAVATKGFEAAREAAPEALEQARADLASLQSAAVRMPDPANPLRVLEPELAGLQAEQKAASQALVDLEREPGRRVERRSAIPGLLAAARQTLSENPEVFVPSPNTDVVVNDARRLRQAAARAFAINSIAALEAELASYDARSDLLVARRDLAARRSQVATTAAEAWQQAVQKLRATDAAQAAAAARQAVGVASAQHPLLGELADENARIAADLPGLARVRQLLEQDLARLRSLERELQSQFEDVQLRVKRAGTSLVIGSLLRTRRGQLPSLRSIEPPPAEPGLTATFAYLEAQKWSDKRTRHVDDATAVDRLLLAADPQPENAAEEALLRARLVDLRSERAVMLEELAKGWSGQLANIEDRAAIRSQLRELLGRFRTFINERVLWIRSSEPMWSMNGADLAEATNWLLDPGQWARLGGEVWSSTVNNGIQFFWLAVLGLALLGRPYWRKRLAAVGVEAAKGSNTRYAPTVAALLYTSCLSLPLPALLYLASARLLDESQFHAFVRSVAAGLREASLLLALALGLLETVRPGGLADVHFKWRAATMSVLRRNLVLLILAAVPLTVWLRALEHHADDAWLGSLGRCLLVAILVLLSVFLWRVLHPQRGLLGSQASGSWLSRFRRFWFVLILGAPFVLLVMILTGYEYTALQLARRLVYTVALVLACAFGQALVLRSLMLARRKMIIGQRAERLRQQREERAANPPGPDEGGDAPAEVPHDVPLDAGSITAQSQAMLRSVVVLVAVIVGWNIWIDVLPALGVLRDEVIWTDTTGPPVTLADLLLAILAIIVTILAAKNLPGLLELLVLQRLKIQSGERHAITTLARYVLVSVGVIVSFSAIGLGWSKVQWLVAGLTLGLGFGLQEIFANFVSGLILLFERPVRVGDLVVLGDLLGRVTRIKIRATTIRDLENKEMVVPNKEFVTGRFVNWTLSDNYVRMTVRVGVAYGSDTRKAKQLMLQAANDCKFVAATPAPRALFLGFGDSALDMELRVYVEDYDQHTHLLDDLHTRIDEAFREHGIEIAFPQRDLHLRTARPLVEFLDRKTHLPVVPPKRLGGE